MAKSRNPVTGTWDFSTPTPSRLRFKPDVKLDTHQIRDQRYAKTPVALEHTEALMKHREDSRRTRATWGNVPATRDELRANPMAGGPKKRKKK